MPGETQCVCLHSIAVRKGGTIYGQRFKKQKKRHGGHKTLCQKAGDRYLRQEDFIRRAVEQNQGRDKDDLQKELFERVRAQKQAGQFDPAGLESFMQSVGPMLSPEQRAQMETLVRSLKNS